MRVATKERADAEAIRVFAENLRQLLLSPPLGQKNVLAIDPGFRTGCKVVCVDRQGKLLHHDVIYPHFSDKNVSEAGTKIIELCKKYQIEAIAIGNGTAGRETETFVKQLGLPSAIQIVMVNESGASIYSASDVAREEFPDQDVTVRGSVSIGRRLMDPLAELVKIDPKSIGVGQYQHDVDQTALKRSLDDVVMICVNGVGVEVNTASKQLLTYVSGLGPQLAGSIVEYRNQHGPFPSRDKLKEVPKLGPKTFEQAAGFLRIRDGRQSARRQRGPSRELSPRRRHGQGPELHGLGPDEERRAPQEDRSDEIRDRHGRPAHAQGHHGRACQAGPGPARAVRVVQLYRGRREDRGRASRA